MKREHCWMTFSEALEYYLEARREAEHFGAGRNREIAKEKMDTAKAHTDALTSLGEEQ